MDFNIKSKFKRQNTEKAVAEALDVLKEASEMLSKEETIVDEQTVVEEPKVVKFEGRKFYGIEKNILTGKFEVVEVVEGPTGLQRTRTVNSHTNSAVAIAKLNEEISRLIMIKKEY